MMSTLTKHGQTAIPAAIRNRYHLTAHTRIEWIDDGHSVSIVPVPDDPIKSLRGKYRGSALGKSLAAIREADRKHG
ncbi:MAG: hypothetical protein PHC61_08245 [Chitinivibrionales bacterium]|nr:hypothetical protein [Chitinivibrionales bacterium]